MFSIEELFASCVAATAKMEEETTEQAPVAMEIPKEEEEDVKGRTAAATTKTRGSTPSTITSGAPAPLPGTEGYHSLSHAYETYLSHDAEEQNHWEDVCRSFRQYATFAMAQWANHQYRLHALPESQRRFLPAALKRETVEFQERAVSFKEAAIRNQFCLDCILRHAGQQHSQECSTTTKNSSDAQMSKVSSVLKSLARDWSAEGQAERDMTYNPIKATIQKYLPLPRNKSAFLATSSTATVTLPSKGQPPRRPIKICVPGAGVGRLACELASLGYAVQGNEFSLYMLLASDFILNGGVASPEKPLRISPFLLESRNVKEAGDPTRPIPIPDVDPYSLMSDRPSGGEVEPPEFSMAGGEFVSIYSSPREKGAWDCVVACFFLDTSPCVVEYLQVIHHMLRPGGYLVNFGPLLWHWSGPAMRPDDRSMEDYHSRYSYLDKKYMQSVDLPWEDVREIMVNIGFEFVEEREGQCALYTADQRSMMSMNYRCVQFVARRKEDAEAKPSSQPTPAPTVSGRTVP